MVDRQKPLVIFVCGDRDWDDMGRMIEVLEQHEEGSWLLEGGAKGADLMGKFHAEHEGRFYPIEMPYFRPGGRAGGPMRNRQMALLLTSLRNAGHEIVCYAFHDDIANSQGTANMLQYLRKLRISYTLYCSSRFKEAIVEEYDSRINEATKP